VILSYQLASVVIAIDEAAHHTSLCQQKVEKIMPTYVHGTVMPDMSDLMYRRSESERIGILFRFQRSLEYGFIGCVSSVGIALHDTEYFFSFSTFYRPGQMNKTTSPSMCGGMHIGTVLDFHRFTRRLYEPPKFALDVMFCHTNVIEYGICDVF
jgi:hypothetical protein